MPAHTQPSYDENQPSQYMGPSDELKESGTLPPASSHLVAQQSSAQEIPIDPALLPPPSADVFDSSNCLNISFSRPSTPPLPAPNPLPVPGYPWQAQYANFCSNLMNPYMFARPHPGLKRHDPQSPVRPGTYGPFPPGHFVPPNAVPWSVLVPNYNDNTNTAAQPNDQLPGPAVADDSDDELEYIDPQEYFPPPPPRTTTRTPTIPMYSPTMATRTVNAAALPAHRRPTEPSWETLTAGISTRQAPFEGVDAAARPARRRPSLPSHAPIAGSSTRPASGLANGTARLPRRRPPSPPPMIPMASSSTLLAPAASMGEPTFIFERWVEPTAGPPRATRAPHRKALTQFVKGKEKATREVKSGEEGAAESDADDDSESEAEDDQKLKLRPHVMVYKKSDIFDVCGIDGCTSKFSKAVLKEHLKKFHPRHGCTRERIICTRDCCKDKDGKGCKNYPRHIRDHFGTPAKCRYCSINIGRLVDNMIKRHLHSCSKCPADVRATLPPPAPKPSKHSAAATPPAKDADVPQAGSSSTLSTPHAESSAAAPSSETRPRLVLRLRIPTPRKEDEDGDSEDVPLKTRSRKRKADDDDDDYVPSGRQAKRKGGSKK